MTYLIMKFGGAAMAKSECFSEIAAMIETRLKNNLQIVVVVSAMGTTTNQLLKLALAVHPNPPKREQDMLISVGERVSMSLLAMALDRRGIEAISFTGSQAGIITTEDHSEASIIEVRPQRIREALVKKKVVIVAGFQGVSTKKEVTTLQRNGSDISAVAIAAALGGKKVELYKGVPGIGKINPKMHPEAEIFSQLTYEQALEIVKEGAEILHPQCLEIAKKHRILLEIRPFYAPETVGTSITL